MPTFVSIVQWQGRDQARADEVRRAVERQRSALRRRGMHSLTFLRDADVCTGIVVSTCDGPAEVELMLTSILPECITSVESMPFADGPGVPAWISRTPSQPSPPDGFRKALLEAISSPEG